MPSIVYFMIMSKYILPTKSFLWAHRAIGAASTMKTFTGRSGNGKQQQLQQQHLLGTQKKGADVGDVNIRMTPPDIGITIPDAEPGKPQQLNQ